jgi:hypothetical protein
MAKQSNYNGMYLSSLEDSFSDGYTKLVKANKKAIPHYSLLEDVDIRRAVIQSGKVWYFKDNVGNSYIYGFYQGTRPDLKDNSPLKILLDTEAGIKWKNCIALRDRNTGGGWIEKTADDFVKWNIGSTELGKKLGLDPKLSWFDSIKFIESKKIKHDQAILLIVKDVKVTSFNEIWRGTASGILKVLVVIAGALATILSAGTTEIAIIAAAGALFTVIDKIVAGGDMSIGELGNLATKTAPLFMDSTDLNNINQKVEALSKDSTLKMVQTGYNLYNSKLKNSLNDVLGVAGLSGLSDYQEGIDIANEILENIESGDVIGLANKLGVTDAEAEKAKLAYNFLQKSSDLSQVEPNAINAAGALEIPEVQSFILNTYSSLLERDGQNLQSVTAVIPNSQGVIKLINDGYVLENSEVKNLVNLFQGEYSNAIYLKKLAVNAMVEEAKTFANTDKTYFLPSNLPPQTQIEAGRIIKKMKIKVDSTNSQVALALNFDREFI